MPGKRKDFYYTKKPGVYCFTNTETTSLQMLTLCLNSVFDDVLQKFLGPRLEFINDLGYFSIGKTTTRDLCFVLEV